MSQSASRCRVPVSLSLVVARGCCCSSRESRECCIFCRFRGPLATPIPARSVAPLSTQRPTAVGMVLSPATSTLNQPLPPLGSQRSLFLLLSCCPADGDHVQSLNHDTLVLARATEVITRLCGVMVQVRDVLASTSEHRQPLSPRLAACAATSATSATNGVEDASSEHRRVFVSKQGDTALVLDLVGSQLLDGTACSRVQPAAASAEPRHVHVHHHHGTWVELELGAIVSAEAEAALVPAVCHALAAESADATCKALGRVSHSRASIGLPIPPAMAVRLRHPGAGLTLSATTASATLSVDDIVPTLCTHFRLVASDLTLAAATEGPAATAATSHAGPQRHHLSRSHRHHHSDARGSRHQRRSQTPSPSQQNCPPTCLQSWPPRQCCGQCPRPAAASSSLLDPPDNGAVARRQLSRPGWPRAFATPYQPTNIVDNELEAACEADNTIATAAWVYGDCDTEQFGPVLQWMGVNPMWQGCGVGTVLLTAMEQFFAHQFVPMPAAAAAAAAAAGVPAGVPASSTSLVDGLPKVMVNNRGFEDTAAEQYFLQNGFSQDQGLLSKPLTEPSPGFESHLRDRAF
eukprot:m.158244 g.158244  ORF g.158244 m.158244 type:complete len:577 (+) comp17596_c0_seq4:1914-3644(+)